jgi:hypothetical protein
MIHLFPPHHSLEWSLRILAALQELPGEMLRQQRREGARERAVADDLRPLILRALQGVGEQVQNALQGATGAGSAVDVEQAIIRTLTDTEQMASVREVLFCVLSWSRSTLTPEKNCISWVKNRFRLEWLSLFHLLDINPFNSNSFSLLETLSFISTVYMKTLTISATSRQWTRVSSAAAIVTAILEIFSEFIHVQFPENINGVNAASKAETGSGLAEDELVASTAIGASIVTIYLTVAQLWTILQERNLSGFLAGKVRGGAASGDAGALDGLLVTLVETSTTIIEKHPVSS